MSPLAPAETPDQAHLEEVLSDYMQRQDRGEEVDRDSLLAEHPEVADELRSYFLTADEVAVLHRVDPPSLCSFLPAHAFPQPLWIEEPPAARRRVRYVGDYEVLEEAARGGMGVVYRARQLSLQRLVALKMIRTGTLASPADVGRFHAEAEAAGHLDHPNIVPIYEVGEHDSQHYYSMKWVEGGNLARWIADNRPLIGQTSRAHQRAAARLLATLARAVHYAHQRGILHRDLKPANILLSPSERSGRPTNDDLNATIPMIADFGLAKKISSETTLTQPGQIVGTPTYMAPEQAAGGRPLTTATDVYALGAILYELLTGQPPFREPTPVATLVQVLHHDPKPPRTLRPRLDRDLEILCLRCLDKDPQGRYSSAEALAEDLERWLRGEPILASPPRTLGRVVKWARRRPALAALVGLLLVVGVLGLGGVVWQGRRAEREAQLARERAIREEQTAYQRAVALAHAEWQAGNGGRALRLLAEVDESPRRGWEWHYLRRLFASRQPRTLHGHDAAVLAVAFSPSGARLASASADQTLRLWDRSTGRTEQVLRGHEAAVTAVAFSPDGLRLASASGDRTVRLWDAVTGTALRTLPGHTAPLTAIAFSPNGAYVCSVGGESSLDGEPGGGELKIWDITSGKVIAEDRVGNLLSAVAFSPDGKRLAAAGHDMTVGLWDVPAFRRAAPLPGGRAVGGGSLFRPWTGVAFGQGSRLIAAVSTGGSLTTWDAGGSPLYTVPGSPLEPLLAIAFASGGHPYLAAAGADGNVRILHGLNGGPAFVLRGHSRPVTAVAFTPDGSLLASASQDQTIRLWDMRETVNERVLRPHQAAVTAVAFSSDGTRLVTASRNHNVRVSDLATGKVLLTLKGHEDSVTDVACSPEGSLLASSARDGTVRLWDALSGKSLACLRGHEGAVLAVAVAGDGRRLVSTGADGTLRIWDSSEQRERMCLRVDDGEVRATALSPDGTHLAGAAQDGTLHLWDLATGRTVWSVHGHEGGALTLRFSADGRHLLSGGADETVRLSDVVTGTELLRLHGHTDAVQGVAFLAEGRLASAGADRTLKIWDRTTGREFLTLRGHAGPIHDLAVSPDGRRLASAGEDRLVRIWDATPLE